MGGGRCRRPLGARAGLPGVVEKFAAPVAMRTEFLPRVFERGGGSFVGRSAPVQQPGDISASTAAGAPGQTSQGTGVPIGFGMY
jgi:hypothetical protein